MAMELGVMKLLSVVINFSVSASKCSHGAKTLMKLLSRGGLGVSNGLSKWQSDLVFFVPFLLLSVSSRL